MVETAQHQPIPVSRYVSCHANLIPHSCVIFITLHLLFVTFFLTLTMSSKTLRKKKRMMSIEMKQEIISKHKRGVCVNALVKQCDQSSSMICTILKQKDAVKGIKPTKGVIFISKLRTDTHGKMERLLLLWIRKQGADGRYRRASSPRWCSQSTRTSNVRLHQQRRDTDNI